MALKAWNTSSTSLSVQWNPVTQGIIRGYRVVYARVENQSITANKFTCNLTVELTKLVKIPDMVSVYKHLMNEPME